MVPRKKVAIVGSGSAGIAALLYHAGTLPSDFFFRFLMSKCSQLQIKREGGYYQ